MHDEFTRRAASPFQRHPSNPILTAADWPYPASAVFNAGVARVGADTVLLVRVEDPSGISHLTAARSTDGVGDWRVDVKPTLTVGAGAEAERWGVEDPRVTTVEGEHVVAYTGVSPSGPLVCLATTRDFRAFTRHGAVLPPENKDAALFPERIDGRWAMLHRPVANLGGPRADIWVSFSPDLRHWGDHRRVLPAGSGLAWDAAKVGIGPPPLRTDDGWLILYHGVRNTVSGPVYRLGLALLDLTDPTVVLARSREWVMAPQEPYERIGDVPNVVFPCGWLLDEDGETIRLYYGAADTVIGLATARLAALLRELVG